MSETYETIELSGAERNAERLGLFVAWLVSNNLLEPVFEKSAGSAPARVRMQDLTGPEFLTTVLHGALKRTHLSDLGRGFVDDYFVSGRFKVDYDSCEYEGEDEWLRYDEVSPKIGAAFRQHCEPRPKRGSRTANILRFPFRPRNRD